MSEINITSIPVAQTAEELLDWMIAYFSGMRDRQGYIVITGDDLAELMLETDRFKQNAARTDGQAATDQEKGRD